MSFRLPLLLAAVAAAVALAAVFSATLAAAQFLPMTRVNVENAVARGAVANDGSGAVFYFLPSITGNAATADTIIMLQGGFSCDGKESCDARYIAGRNLMSTKWLPATRETTDYLSQDCLVNPAFCKSNMVYVPYVSSDFWVGDANATAAIPWQFRGSRILRAVVEDLIRGFTMDGAKYSIVTGGGASRRVVLSGLSAGAIGTLLSTRRVGDMITAACPTCSYSAVVDSGTFSGFKDPLEHDTVAQCEQNSLDCSFLMECKVGYAVWNAQLDPLCLANANATGLPPYACMFMEHATNWTGAEKGYRTFYAQYLFDAAEMAVDGVIDLLNVTQLQFLAELTLARRTLFALLGSSWSPSCVGHIVAGHQATLSAADIPLSLALQWWHDSGASTAYLDKCFTPDCRKGCPGKKK